MKEINTYRISQLSEILGVSRDALRYYEEKGIIKPKQKKKIIIGNMTFMIFMD